MTDYTEDDFKNARLAVRGQLGVARRVDPDDTRPWFAPAYERQEWLNDAAMAAHGWEPVADTAPLTLDDLETAWDAAKADTMHHDGDVVIVRIDEDNYLIRRMDDRSRLDSTARILSRAPKPREPWQDLADVLLEDGLAFEEDVEGIVKRLHERGVRVTGGEES